ncbi:hypothetical protein AFLA70_683g000371 [Aspergillus flavus AF70]|nr:hypothetical protein AFLA70_683g000371 [Aspergillus flavus AF70]
MRDMDTVNVASDRASAHVGGGVIAGHLQETLKSHGLFTSTGKAKSVGYVFWACGGGARVVLTGGCVVETKAESELL